jgi:hypothetical protein
MTVTSAPRRSVDLGELECNCARTDAHQVLWQLACPQEVVARRVSDAVEPGQVGHARPGPAGDQRVLELDRLPIALDPMLIEEARVAAEERDPVVTSDLVLVEGDAFVDYPLHALHHRRKVDLDVAEADAELGGLAGVVGDLGGSDQSLGRDAPARDSGAADEAGLEQSDPSSAAPGGADACPAAHSAADHGDIEATHARFRCDASSGRFGA